MDVNAGRGEIYPHQLDAERVSPPERRAAAQLSVLRAVCLPHLAHAGLSDLTLRDVGVLGLAVCLTGRGTQRLTA
jgi:hypothetical protein